MPDHDEFCPNDFPLVGAVCTFCQRLAKARADERAKNEQMAHAAVRAEARAVRELEAEVADTYAEGYRDGENAMQTMIDQAKADVRERIAQAIVAMRNRWLDNYDKGVTGDGPVAVLSAFDRSARIARNGGRDE